MIKSHYKKIAILGNSGSGKTTVARKLAETLNLPIIHLDQYAWKPNWHRRPFDEFYALHNELCQKDAWVMEGNYIRTLETRFLYADVVIFIDTQRYACIWRVIKRTIFNYGKTLECLPENCPQRLNGDFLSFLKWVWHFNTRYRNFIVSMLDRYRSEKQIYVVRSSQELNDLIKKISS